MTTSKFQFKMPFILWLLTTIFFSFQFVLRLSAGVLREEIINRYMVDTSAFGSLAGYYYLGYAGMQIPIGFMLDRFNFRLVTFISIITTAIGTFIVAKSTSWDLVLIGRFIIGAGSAVGILSVAKITKSFFPEKFHSILLGFSFTLGLSGAVVGGTPTKIFYDNFGYENTFLFLTFITIIIAFVIISINDKKIAKFEHEQEHHVTIKKVLLLAINPNILFIGICGGLMVGSLEGFADVWAIPFMNQIYGFSINESIFVASVVYIGMCFGGPILGYFSTSAKSVIAMIFITGMLMSTLFVFMFYFVPLTYTQSIVTMFILGILCSYQVLVFSLTTQIVTKNYASISIAIVNCINMSFGHIFHSIISNQIQYNWNGAVNEAGMPVYSLGTFMISLSPIPVFCVMGTIGFIFLSSRIKKGKLKIIQ